MTHPTSHAKGAAPDGQIKGASGKPEFSAAAEGRTNQATAKVAPEPKHTPERNHQPKTPDGQRMTQQSAEQKMSNFQAQEKQKQGLNELKDRAKVTNDRIESKAHDNIKGKDDLQK